MMDIYSSFTELCRKESQEAFEIAVTDRRSPVSIIAPHGGHIEPGTTELARLTAGTRYNFYSFIAHKVNDGFDLHITSHRFDEPSCIALLQRCDHVISLHGFKFDTPMIYLGGLDEALRRRIHNQLRKFGLPVEPDPPRYRGKHPNNICNRSRTGQGVQLEISRQLRHCEQARSTIASALQRALEEHLPLACASAK